MIVTPEQIIELDKWGALWAVHGAKELETIGQNMIQLISEHRWMKIALERIASSDFSGMNLVDANSELKLNVKIAQEALRGGEE